MTARIRVGCSGWNYRDWRGIVYPADLPARSWFAFYAARFDTVELNNTFYRLPTETTMDAWRANAPPGFIYAVKLGAYGSHRRKLSDPASWLSNHVDRARRLGPSLGPTLVQLPPRWHRDTGRLEAFLAVAPRDLRWAVEFRDPSWLHEDVYTVLQRYGAALCIHDLLPRHPWRLTADWAYVRFHGAAALERKYEGRYGGRRLWRPAARLEEWADAGHDVFAYFNNDIHGAAVDDAEWLARRLGVGREPAQAGATRS